MLAVAVLIAWAAAPAFAVPLCFDRILLKDGRIIEGDLLPSDDAAITKLSISGIEVPVRNDLIAKTFAENLENYVPKNKQEEEFLKKGFVLFEGSWMSTAHRDAELRKRAEADKAAVEDLKKRSNWKSATVTTSPHFEVKSNCDAPVVKDYVDRLENFYKAFTSDWGVKITPGNKQAKLGVEVHRGYGDSMNITMVGDTMMFSFNFGSGAISVTHLPDDLEESLRDLYLSASWQLIYSSNPGFLYPIWFTDGLSEYFATTTVDKAGKFHFGDPVYSHCLSLMEAQEQDKLPPLRDAILSDGVEWNPYHTPLRWAFVHFLLESPKYSKPVRSFFGSLPNNPDAKIQKQQYGRNGRGVLDYSEDADCLTALEKRLGVKLDQLEKEMLADFAEMTRTLTPKAYYQAAERALSRAQRDDEDDELTDEQRLDLVKTAFKHLARAEELGIDDADFYRRYAELLRKGGIKESKRTLKPLKPDPEAAFGKIQKAISLDPLAPYAYTEAAGILIMDGPIQDLDRAANYANAGLKIGGTRNAWVKSLHDELMALIEPAREARRNKSLADAEAAKADNRKWHVNFYYKQGEEPPPNLADLSTDELRELIRSGKVTGHDHLFQSWQVHDAEGKSVVGDNPWDKDWVDVSAVPVFADDLAFAAKAASDPAAPAADPAAVPASKPAPESGAPAEPASGTDGG